MLTEDLKFFLANQMQSFASILLNTLLDKRFNSSSINSLAEDKVEVPCRNELIRVSSSALKNEHWALRVFDSNGRLQTGLMSGSLFNSIGNYEQCLSVQKYSVGSSNAIKFCIAHIDLTKEAKQLSLLTGQPETTFTPLGGRAAKLGLCIPASCSSNDISLLANHILRSSLSPLLSIQQVQCSNSLSGNSFNSANHYSIGLILSLALIILLLSASIAATIFDSTACYKLTDNATKDKRNKSRLINKFIDTFSLIRAAAVLMAHRRVALPKSSIDLSPLDGLRVVSMLWIIVIHSYNFGLQWLMFDNIRQVEDIYKTPSIQWLANGTFSVDNFFILSGLLAWLKHIGLLSAKVQRRQRKEMTTLRKQSDISLSSQDEVQLSSIESVEKINNTKGMITLQEVIVKSFRRYLRLVPTMMVMILLSVNVLPHLTYGPNWSNSTTMFDQWCRSNWFINLFMLHNIIRTPNMCFSHSWFVAVDLQLFILSQLLILTFSKLPIANKWLLSTAIFLSQVIVSAIIYIYRLPGAPLVPTKSLESINDYYALLYIKPHYWLASYFMGILLAFNSASFVSNVSGRRKSKLKSWLIVTVQLLLAATMSMLILSTLPYLNGNLFMSNIQAALYSFIARPLWSLCIAYILFFVLLKSRASHEIYFPVKILRKILGAHFWLPFSRLTYSSYLLHPLIMAAFYGSRTETFQFSHYLLIYFTLGNIVLTYIGALIIYMFIERPIQASLEIIIEQSNLFIRSSPNNSSSGNNKQPKCLQFLQLSLRSR